MAEYRNFALHLCTTTQILQRAEKTYFGLFLAFLNFSRKDMATLPVVELHFSVFCTFSSSQPRTLSLSNIFIVHTHEHEAQSAMANVNTRKLLIN